MGWLAWVRKALTGAATTGLAALVKSAADGSISGDEWAYIAAAAVVGGVAVFLIPNGPRPTP